MEPLKFSVKLDDLSFEELFTLMQGLCNQANKLREQIKYVQGKIEARAEQNAPRLRLVSGGGESLPKVDNGTQG